MDRTAARAERIDHRKAGGGEVVAVADTAGIAPGDALPERRAAIANKREQA